MTDSKTKPSGFAGLAAQAKKSAARQTNIAKTRQKLQAKQAARAKNPLPKSKRVTQPRPSAPPPAVQRATGVSPEVAAELEAEARRLQSSFGRLDKQAELGDIYDDIGRLEDLFVNLPSRLDQLRTQGFVHSGHLETRIDALDDEWDDNVRPRLESQLKTQLMKLDREINALEALQSTLTRPSESGIKAFEMKMDTAENAVTETTRNLQSLYEGIEKGLGEVEAEVRKAEWMMTQLAQSPEIQLLEAEGPLMAVEAEWERTGDDDKDPDGVLYLTDQRLIFEQNEEKAKKKFLFITTDSEKVQKLLINEQVRDIVNVKHSEERRGFSLGKDDLLEIEFGGQAEVTRAQFHLKGQDSSDWAAVLKLVRNGEIDELRAEAFVEEMEAAEAATASIPEQCPSCLAAIPPQPRGVLSYTCEFCGGVVTAVVADA